MFEPGPETSTVCCAHALLAYDYGTVQRPRRLRVQPDFLFSRPDLDPVGQRLMGQTVKVQQLWEYLFDCGFARIRVCNIFPE